MIVGGIFVVLHSAYLDFKYSAFINGLPDTLISGPFPTIFIASVIFLFGCVLAVWLYRVKKGQGFQLSHLTENRKCLLEKSNSGPDSFRQ